MIRIQKEQIEEWLILSQQESYRIIGLTRIDSNTVVLTSWIGFDFSSLRSKFIFKTLVVSENELLADKDILYTTLEDAQEGHDRIVQEIRKQSQHNQSHIIQQLKSFVRNLVITDKK